MMPSFSSCGDQEWLKCMCSKQSYLWQYILASFSTGLLHVPAWWTAPLGAVHSGPVRSHFLTSVAYCAVLCRFQGTYPHAIGGKALSYWPLEVYFTWEPVIWGSAFFQVNQLILWYHLRGPLICATLDLAQQVTTRGGTLSWRHYYGIPSFFKGDQHPPCCLSSRDQQHFFSVWFFGPMNSKWAALVSYSSF